MTIPGTLHPGVRDFTKISVRNGSGRLVYPAAPGTQPAPFSPAGGSRQRGGVTSSLVLALAERPPYPAIPVSFER